MKHLSKVWGARQARADTGRECRSLTGSLDGRGDVPRQEPMAQPTKRGKVALSNERCNIPAAGPLANPGHDQRDANAEWVD